MKRSKGLFRYEGFAFKIACEIYGPNGSRVEITTVWVGEICEEPTTLVYYNLTVPGKGTQERMVSLDTWDTLAGWDKARLHS